MESPTDQRFPKRSRLTRASEFRAAKQTGARRGSRHFTVWMRPNQDVARLGLAVSRKVGKAHERNLLKRRLREIFRRRLVSFREKTDFLIVAKPGAAALPFAELSREIAGLVGQENRR